MSASTLNNSECCSSQCNSKLEPVLSGRRLLEIHVEIKKNKEKDVRKRASWILADKTVRPKSKFKKSLKLNLPDFPLLEQNEGFELVVSANFG